MKARAIALAKSPTLWLALAAVVAAVLRARVLVGRGGPWAYPVDYDEGVYFSAAALLTRGVLPWRDFVFVHPPGVLFGWAPFAAFGGVHAFEVCRFASAVLGGANVFLLGRLLLPRTGPFGALTAACLYAVYPEAMATERGPFIEPWLNFTCLLATHASLQQRWRSAGALWALALTVKLWALLWLPAVLLAWLGKRDAKAVVAFAVTLAVLMGPLVLLAPSAFWHQVIELQFLRPPDATQGAWARLRDIFHPAHLGAVLFGLGAVALLATRKAKDPAGTLFFAITTVVIICGFLGASAYWGQYNAHLAVPQCALAGFGAAALGALRLRWAVMAAALLPSLRIGPAGRTQELVALREVLQRQPGCVYAFEPAWSLAAGLLPAHSDGAPVVVDSYGAMLAAALPGSFPEAGAAMRSAPAQRFLLPRLEACPTIVMGWRGDWQLSDETKAWVRAHFSRVSEPPLDVWVRSP